MMKYILSISLLLLLSACTTRSTLNTLPDPVPDQNRTSTTEGVSLSLPQTIFHESPSQVEVTLSNVSNQDYTIGDFYHIEIKKDNAWYIITYSDKIFFENRRFKDYGRILYAGDEMTQTFSVESLGITLPPGEYRLVKGFSPKTGTYYKTSIAVEFSVQ